MFEQYPYLVGMILTLLHLCLLVYFTKEVYYFYLDLTHKEEKVDDDEEQDSSYTIPSLEEWIKAQHSSIRESICYELKRGGRLFIPSFLERLDQRVFNNVLNELREKGYSVAVETGVDGYIRSVTFDVPETTEERLQGLSGPGVDEPLERR